MSARTEALLYAADKAEHVDTVVRPALERDEIVITDRYVDTMLAYQGAGRDLSQQQVVRLCRWATGGLRPHLTVLLDVPPEVGLARGDGPPDRLEREPLEFHTRARQRFLDLAALDPDRYLVLDATQPPDLLAAQVRMRVDPLLADLKVRATPAREESRGFAEENAGAQRAAGQAETAASSRREPGT
jgi:dTMP kinase